MIDSELHLTKDSRSVLVSTICPTFENHQNEKETHRSLRELKELMRTLQIETIKEFVQTKKSIDPATVLGKGKLQEIKQFSKANHIDLLVFDFELSASQIRNIKKITDIAVVDRCHVILEIFSQHAQTREAKIQIEISRLNYLLPRLSGFWSHLGRQRGGIGVRGGEGEQQIELDRRIIRNRIEHYKKELVDIEKSREQQRKRRKNQAVTAALVGYTNAGKSSLMNRLCQVHIKVEDKLFATLDSTYRMLNPDTKPPMILIDTVGFLSNLPNTLIDGFKTTLESALEADLLIIVCDISDENVEKHISVTQDVLTELGLQGKDRFFVFNKKDQLNDPLRYKLIKRKYPNSFIISTYNKEDINKLRKQIVEYFLSKQEHYDIFVPYDEGQVHSIIASKTNIISNHNYEKGIYYRVRTPDFIFNKLNINKFVMGPSEVEKLLKR